MTISTISNSKTTNTKFILWIFILSIVSVTLSGRINYRASEYSNVDYVKYREMASVSPEISENVIKPFAYRILAPWVAGMLPFKIENNFYLLNLIALLFLPILFYYFLVDFKIKNWVAFTLTVCFLFNRYFYQFLAWDYFQLCDSISLILITTAFLLIRQKSWLSLGLVLIMGVLTKEVVLIIIPTAFIYLHTTFGTRSDYIKLFIVSITSIMVFFLIRMIIQPAGGETLITQFLEGVPIFFTPSAFAKKFVIAFTPFGFVPLFYYKDLIEFFRKNQYLFVFLLGIIFSSFFGNFERLMAPIAPVYFLFLGTLIMKYLGGADKTRVLKNFLLMIISLAIVSSFYHLWGIVKLPNSETTLIFTIIVLSITFLLFLGLKYTQFRVVKFWK